MTNASKWLVAIPFSMLVAFVIPSVVAGDFFWFLAGWPDLLYVLMTAGMWLGATAFVDVSRPRGRRDAANYLLPLGLILSVPVAVYDRTHLVASGLPVWVSILGLSFCSLTIICGVWSRLALAGSYMPQGAAGEWGHIVRSGPYR